MGLCTYNYWPYSALPTESPIDKILVEKGKRELHAMSNGEIIKTYTISLGFNPTGHKEFEGDGKTPEGIYTINNKNPNSGYHLNLGVSYPNDADRKHAEELGKPPGGDIKIHGLHNKMGLIGRLHRFTDWTHGCIALTNFEVKELFDYVPIGTVIEIRE